MSLNVLPLTEMTLLPGGVIANQRFYCSELNLSCVLLGIEKLLCDDFC